VVALREGKIRVAPHLLNSTQDIDRLLVVMEKAQKGRDMAAMDERLKSLGIVLITGRHASGCGRICAGVCAVCSFRVTKFICRRRPPWQGGW